MFLQPLSSQYNCFHFTCFLFFFSQAMISSACIEHLDFLHSPDDILNFKPFEEKLSTAGFTPFITMPSPVMEEAEEVLNVMVGWIIFKICIFWLWRKINSSWLKNIMSRMFTDHMYLLTSHAYNYLIMCRQIVDVGLNYWCCVPAMLGAISLCARRWALAHLEYYLLSIHL